MIRECFRSNTGIQFEADRLRALGIEPRSLWPKVAEPGSDSHKHEHEHAEHTSNFKKAEPFAVAQHETTKDTLTKISTSSSPRSPSLLRTSLKRESSSGANVPKLNAPKMDSRRALNYSVNETLVDGDGREENVSAAGVASSEVIDERSNGTGENIEERVESEDVITETAETPDLLADNATDKTDASTTASIAPSALNLPPRVSIEAASTEALDKLIDEMKQEAEVAAAKNPDATVRVKAEAETEDYDNTLDQKNSRSRSQVHVEERSSVDEKESVHHDEKRSSIHIDEKTANPQAQAQSKPTQTPIPTPIPWPAPTPLEAEANIADAHAPMFDQLQKARWWWALELIPIRERVQRPDGSWKKKWTLNRGRARSLPLSCACGEEPLHVHRSVQVRMHDGTLKYKPRVDFGKSKVVWVD